jgi:hypothetical protein
MIIITPEGKVTAFASLRGQAGCDRRAREDI